MFTNPPYSANKPAKKSHFGIAALAIGIITALFSAASYGVVFLNISLDLFNILNNLTALVFCTLTPITMILGMIGFTRKNDSKSFSLISVILVTIPFLIVFASFLKSMAR